jgi:hypothetical protein
MNSTKVDPAVAQRLRNIVLGSEDWQRAKSRVLGSYGDTFISHAAIIALEIRGIEWLGDDMNKEWMPKKIDPESEFYSGLSETERQRLALTFLPTAERTMLHVLYKHVEIFREITIQMIFNAGKDRGDDWYLAANRFLNSSECQMIQADMRSRMSEAREFLGLGRVLGGGASAKRLIVQWNGANYTPSLELWREQE